MLCEIEETGKSNPQVAWRENMESLIILVKGLLDPVEVTEPPRDEKDNTVQRNYIKLKQSFSLEECSTSNIS